MTAEHPPDWFRRPVLEEVGDERERQDAKWGEQNHPDGTGPLVRWVTPSLDATMAAWVREARYRCESRTRRGVVTYLDILAEEFFEAAAEADKARLREELIQVAAVAVAWVEKLDREAVLQA